jgi:hypothetical protein
MIETNSGMQQHHSIPWTSSGFPSRKNESQIESKRLDNEKVKKKKYYIFYYPIWKLNIELKLKGF